MQDLAFTLVDWITLRVGVRDYDYYQDLRA